MTLLPAAEDCAIRINNEVACAVSKTHFNLNRPIHLARRDVFFERAVELLNMPLQELDIHLRIQHAEVVLSLLKTSESHAFFATRSNAPAQEHDFLRFLKLIADNVQSIHAMMQQQSHLEGEEGFLCQFLGATAEQCALPAMHYQRRAEDILQGLWHVLQLAHAPYRALQKTNFEGMKDDERIRYKKAYDSFRQEVTAKYTMPIRR